MEARSCTPRRRSCTPLIVALFVLVVAQLACGQPAEEWQLRGWTVTPSVVAQPTQTPQIVVVQQTVVAQQTVVVVAQVTPTPKPICVVAQGDQGTVNLRPSPSETNYPIMILKNGDDLLDLGGRSGKWWFVQYKDKQGWIYSDYVSEDCSQ